jgi:hypothetical protein
MEYARYATIVIAVVIMSVYLPQFYQKIFTAKTGQLRLLYSPVIKRFLIRERLKNNKFVNWDETGKTYDSRLTYETLLPFIYYKDMELLGKLPITIDGKTFDKDFIKKNRQVFEMEPGMLPDHHPQIQLYPLFESRPDVAMLQFPPGAFRISNRMEFIDSPTNTINERLTKVFTDALKKADFRFPAKLIAGKTTNLKPFDEGYFVVDASGNVFHIKRVNGKPFCVKTPIPADIGVRNIKVSENRRREFYGMLITNRGKICLITYDNYRLIPLPVEGYDPDTMDFKLIVNPVCRTAIYSDDKTIYGVAMDTHYRIIATYKYNMKTSKAKLADIIYSTLFPFVIQTKSNASRYVTFNLVWNGWISFVGIALSIFIYIMYVSTCKFDLKETWPDLVIIVLTGVYGLTAAITIKNEP